MIQRLINFLTSTREKNGENKTELKKKYNIIYQELIEEDNSIFKIKEGYWGVLNKKEEILIDPIYDSVAYNSLKKWFVCTNFNAKIKDAKWTYYFHNTKGVFIKKISDYNAIRIDDGGNIFCRINLKKEAKSKVSGKQKVDIYKYGMLDNNFNEIIKPIYESLGSLSTDLLVAKENGLYGIITIKEEKILNFICTKLIGSFNDKKNVLAKIDGIFYNIGKNGKKIKQFSFSHLLFPRSNTYGAPTKTSRDKFKVIVNGIQMKDSDEYFTVDEMNEYKGKWGVIDNGGNSLIKSNYDFIDFFRDNRYLKAFIGEMEFPIDEDGNILMKNSLCGVIDYKENIVVPIKFNWIEEIGKELWAVNLGGQVFFSNEYQEEYWTVKGGKWGVMNNQSKLIVPIEYDCIMLNWFRIKDYIFVQKGTSRFDGELSYNVFKFNGQQIVKNKPNYKNHIFHKG